MPTVTYNGASYACTTAIKGDTYIRLLDAEDAVIASFEGITDFSKFNVSDGSWTDPEDLDQCCLVVMRRDGTLVKTTKKVCDVGNNSNLQTNKAAVTPTASEQTIYPDSGYDAMTKVVVRAIPTTYKYVDASNSQAYKEWMPSATDQEIPAGTYCTGKQIIKGDADHTEGNIKKGITLFGKTGTYSGDWVCETGVANYISDDSQGIVVPEITRDDPAVLLVFTDFVFDDGDNYSTSYVLNMMYSRDSYTFADRHHWAVYAAQSIDDNYSAAMFAGYTDGVYSLSASSSGLTISLASHCNIHFRRKVNYTVFAFYDS